MLHISTKKILICHTFVNVKFKGVLDLAGAVKIWGLDTFSRCKSRWGGYCVNYGSTLKLTGKGHLYRVYIYSIKGYHVSN